MLVEMQMRAINPALGSTEINQVGDDAQLVNHLQDVEASDRT
jgi:hypothetical protein